MRKKKKKEKKMQATGAGTVQCSLARQLEPQIQFLLQARVGLHSVRTNQPCLDATVGGPLSESFDSARLANLGSASR